MSRTITNYVTNPRAHVDTTGWILPTTRATTDPLSGDGYFQAVTAGSAPNEGISSNTFATGVAAAGQTWTVLFWVRGTPGGTVRSVMGEYQGTTYQREGYGSVITLTEEWTRYTHTMTLTDADTTGLRIGVRTNTTQAITIEATHFLLTPGTTLYDYFDGDSPKAVWTGTPHASTSVLTIPDMGTAGLLIPL